MTTWWARLLACLLLLAVCALGMLWLHRDRTEPLPAAMHGISPTTLSDPVLIARGEYLATAGDCRGCHTAPGGLPYAGGRSVTTPFGDVPAPNITPDKATGIGSWRFEDFWRALHSGIGRDGRLLYPAFPYTAFTKVRADDALAIFAYLRSLPAVEQTSGRPNLSWPYSVRDILLGWRLLYFHEEMYQPDPAQSAGWNRGAYLVQGLGHCNECHDARNVLGGITGPWLSGGEMPAQHWYAPDLSTQRNGGLQGWSRADIVDLLKTGQSSHGVAFGPMAEVVTQSTQHLGGDDLQAIAEYLQSLPARAVAMPSADEGHDKASVDDGEKIYVQRCAGCHGVNGRGVAGIYPPLSDNPSVTEPTGMNATRAVLLGGFSPGTAANPRPYSMPPFAQQLDDAQVAAVVSYIRQAWSNRASMVPERDVGKYRATPVD